MIYEAQTRREREVWEACDDLWSQGITFKKMTGDVLRDHLATLGYNKGSFTEIFKYRKTWVKSRGINLTEQALPKQLTPPLSDPISRAAQQVREEILAEAQEEISKIHEKAQEDIATLTAQYQALQTAQENLLAAYEKMKSSHEDLHIKNIALAEDNQQLSIQLGKYETQLQSKEEAYRHFQLEKENQLIQLKISHQEEIERLERRYEKDGIQYEHDIESLKTILEEQRHQAMVTVDQLKVSCQKLEVEIEKTRAHDKALRDWNQNLQQHLHRLQKEIKEKTSVHEQLQNAYQESQTLISQQDIKIIYLEKTVEQNQQTKEEEQKLIEQWKAKVDQLSTENTVLQTELKLLKRQISQERGAVAYGET